MMTGQRINTLVIPAVPRLPDGVGERVHEMQSRGARVIFVSFAADGFVGSEVVTYPEDVGEALTGRRRDGRVSQTVRTSAERTLYFYLNESAKKYEGTLRLPGADSGRLEKFDFSDCEWYEADGGTLSLCPLELGIYSITFEGSNAPGSGRRKPTAYGEALVPRGWSVRRRDGGGEAHTDELCDWRELFGAYSGVADYGAEVTVPEDGTYRLNLGRVCYAAAVCVDGGEPVNLPFAPFETDLCLAAGEHTLRISVLNADAASVLGTAESEKRARAERRFRDICENDRDCVASGLFGPVTLRRCHN